jgi:UDP-3-O-[3-hydroxymyristoyl] glucosamine N-acyltransferase
MPAYVYTGVTKTTPDGTTVRQIKNAATGEIGGYIESNANLDASSNAWVGPDAMVWGGAYVTGDALVTGSAQVYERATVSGDSLITKGVIRGNACLTNTGNARPVQRWTGNHSGCRPWHGTPL